MTTSTPVERRRARARLALLSITTALCSAVPASAYAQTAGSSAPIPVDHFLESPGGVDMRSGQFSYSVTDLSLGNVASGHGIALMRTNDNNNKSHPERFAQFSHNWEIFVSERKTTQHSAGDYVQTTFPQEYQMSVSSRGRNDTFRTNGAFGETLSINGKHSTLTKVQSGSTYYYTYQAVDGSVTTFLPMVPQTCFAGIKGLCAYAASMNLPDGTAYRFDYDNSSAGSGSLLRQVVSNNGYALVFEYASSSSGTPYISKACAVDLSTMSLPTAAPWANCPSGVPVSTYSYQGNFMQKVVDMAGQEWTFSNTYTNAITDYDLSFYKPGEPTAYLTNTYHQTEYDNLFRVVSKQVFKDGPTYDYGFDEVPQGDSGPGSLEVAGGKYSYAGSSVLIAYGKYRLPKSNDKTLYITPGPETVTNENGKVYTANYCLAYPIYDGCRIVPKRWDKTPEGIQTSYTYDGFYNVVDTTIAGKSDTVPSVELSAQYTCVGSGMCDKPRYSEDALKNRTDYTYTSFGAVQSQLQPPSSPGGARPLKLYSYGQKFAYVKSGSGALVPATSAIWLPSLETQCQMTGWDGTSTPACDSGAPKIVTSYTYGADGTPHSLLLRGKVVTADGTSLRTCYQYDNRGNKIAETSPRAGLTSCP